MKEQDTTSVHEVLQQKEQKKRDEKYNEYVKQVTPTHNKLLNLSKAFLMGGIICLIGQLLLTLYKNIGFDKDTCAAYTSLSLILLSVIFTGFGWYSKLAKFAGAGTLVPITGFANSVAAPAIEFKREGQIFGIGCKIFTIAGPVILYGIVSSWILGLIYYIIIQITK